MKIDWHALVGLERNPLDQENVQSTRHRIKLPKGDVNSPKKEDKYPMSVNKCPRYLNLDQQI